MRMEVKDDCASGAEAKARMLAAHRRRREMLRPAPRTIELKPLQCIPVALPVARRPKPAASLQVVPPAPTAQREPKDAEAADTRPIIPHVRTVVQAAIQHYDVKIERFLLKRRFLPEVTHRQRAMYLAITMTQRSLLYIGSHFGNADHATLIHARHKIQRLIDEGDKETIDDVAALKAHIETLVRAQRLARQESERRRIFDPVIGRGGLPVPDAPRQPTIPEIKQATADHFNVGIRSLMYDRSPVNTRSRRVAMYLAAHLTSQSCRDIGKQFEYRAAGCVADTYALVKRRLKEGDTALLADINAISARLGAKPCARN